MVVLCIENNNSKTNLKIYIYIFNYKLHIYIKHNLFVYLFFNNIF